MCKCELRRWVLCDKNLWLSILVLTCIYFFIFFPRVDLLFFSFFLWTIFSASRLCPCFCVHRWANCYRPTNIDECNQSSGTARRKNGTLIFPTIQKIKEENNTARYRFISSDIVLIAAYQLAIETSICESRVNPDRRGSFEDARRLSRASTCDFNALRFNMSFQCW